MAKINRDKLKQPTEERKAWIDTVHHIEKEVFLLEVKYNKEMEHRGHDRFLQRSTLSFNVMEKCDEVQRCWEEGSIFLTEELVDKPPEPVIKIKQAPNIENLQSLHGIIEEILECLRKKDVKRIGLWGKVGVGKTAIMQNLNNNKEVARTFDLVIFATLADEGKEEKLQCVDEKLERAKQKLQHAIAQRLKLDIEGITNSQTIASRISTELESKRYLLLLDEAWGIFNLDDIGIHENEEDSKVVWACRHRNIYSGMDVDEEVEVKPLSDTEARKLFFEKLRPNMSQSDTDRTDRKKKSDIDQIADLVIKECANLPLVIDRAARAFRKIERRQQPEQRRINSWLEELQRLRKWQGALHGISEEILEADSKLKSKLQDQSDQVGISVASASKTLEVQQPLEEPDFFYFHDSSEFEDCDEPSSEARQPIRPQDIQKKLVVFQGGMRLTAAPNVEEWESLAELHLMDNELSDLPDNLRCPVLQALFLQRNNKLRKIPPLFFDYMPALRILNLSRTRIKSLPESLFGLVKLRRLFLNHCHLLSSLSPDVGKLELLEVLDLEGTKILELPEEVKKLTKLTSLEVSFLEPMNHRRSEQSNY